MKYDKDAVSSGLVRGMADKMRHAKLAAIVARLKGNDGGSNTAGDSEVSDDELVELQRMMGPADAASESEETEEE